MPSDRVQEARERAERNARRADFLAASGRHEAADSWADASADVLFLANRVAALETALRAFVVDHNGFIAGYGGEAELICGCQACRAACSLLADSQGDAQ